jgi:predicted ATPase
LCIKAGVIARAPQTRATDAEAEALLREALTLAKAQSAKAVELRAAESLTRLLDRQGRGDEGRAILRAIFEWFTEGFDCPLLVDARALLESP